TPFEDVPSALPIEDVVAAAPADHVAAWRPDEDVRGWRSRDRAARARRRRVATANGNQCGHREQGRQGAGSAFSIRAHACSTSGSPARPQRRVLLPEDRFGAAVSTSPAAVICAYAG